MPTDTAATWPCSGFALMTRRLSSVSTASANATNPPVIAAVRVPPSACSTSQSMVTVRSPSAPRSTAARSERPISRWISWLRPVCLPRAASRGLRVCVARGSMPYSAVTQPWDLPRRNGGTPSSTLAVQSTRVSPNSTSTEPSAWSVKRRVKRTARSESMARLLWRKGRFKPSLLVEKAQGADRRVVAGGASIEQRLVGEGLQRILKRQSERDESAGDQGFVEVGPEAVGADQQYIARQQGVARADGHLRQDRLAAEAGFDEVAHGVILDLAGTDDAFAHQQLDVAVIAGAVAHAPRS